ncbi:hypothetical protein RJ639_016278 [Escallonia herrerae]|uniref:Uncharacterized protein n=1 Tax=Escallonia herrerae TaxID=1293975 RepID=A0AA88VE37_9ASTE|nr:hypothetical protein RJ639_016278 [Escallonia herrerae]
MHSPTFFEPEIESSAGEFFSGSTRELYHHHSTPPPSISSLAREAGSLCGPHPPPPLGLLISPGSLAILGWEANSVWEATRDSGNFLSPDLLAIVYDALRLFFFGCREDNQSWAIHDTQKCERFEALQPVWKLLKGVQPLLGGVLSYLPRPTEVSNYALDQTKNEEEVELSGTPVGPLVALAFKLEEGRFGESTYLRIYEGVIRKGDFIININTGKKVKGLNPVPRLVRLHSNEMEDIQEAHAGQIVAVFGVDCASGDTFTDGSVKYTMTSMNVPEPVMLLAVSPVSKEFSKALNCFQREDPTFHVGLDAESGQVDATVAKPHVNFRETVTQRAEFDYLYKKQSGGQDNTEGRKGLIGGNDQEGDDSVVTAHGKDEFTMEYKEHSPVSSDVQMQLVNTYKATKAAE